MNILNFVFEKTQQFQTKNSLIIETEFERKKPVFCLVFQALKASFSAKQFALKASFPASQSL